MRKAVWFLLFVAALTQGVFAQGPGAEEEGAPTFTVTDLPVGRPLRIAVYGLALWMMFHLVVVLLEESHLRRARGAGYEEYCRSVRRWF